MDTTDVSYVSIRDAWIDVHVKITPRSKRERIGAVTQTAQGNRLEIWVGAPPVDGKANQAVEQLLAKALKIPPSHCAIYQGHTSRYKTVRLPYNEDVYNKLVALWPATRPQQAELF